MAPYTGRHCGWWECMNGAVGFHKDGKTGRITWLCDRHIESVPRDRREEAEGLAAQKEDA